MKTRSTFQKALDKIDAKIQELHEQAFSVRRFYQDGNIKQAYESALRLEEVSEKTVLLTRALPAYTGNPKARLETENLIKLSIPIEIGFTEEGWFSLRIPALLPKKDAGSADYIRSSLYLAMREFFLDSQPVRYNDCVLIYRHIYARDRPERKKRDHDNIELNAIVDALALYALYDDGPLRCEHHYCSLQDDRDATTVLLVPQDAFTVCYTRIKTAPQMLLPLFP